MNRTIQVGDSFENKKTGERYTFRATAVSTNGAYVQFDNTIPAGMSGPPMHIHPKQEETFLVLSGTLYATIDGRGMKFLAGETAVIPPNTPHIFDNKKGEAVQFRVTLTPALDSDQLFASLITAGNQSKSGQPSLRQLAKMLPKLESKMQIVGPPVWLQNALLRVLSWI